ncbi:HoxN/HupN/NixA family nickel/cobalt transporter [Microbacterium sp. 18062]|uniref:HoxN/HupN/NixA family nickel/cobalt transporter n=1 Tax=Microbacterium sp. 18062 TaxID=2681410 RepID=UPI00135928AE|nr:hypothetical protein [Microbacterium sp. 18062]
MASDTRRVVVTVAALVLIAWGGFVALVLPVDLPAGTSTFGVGLALTAFALGARHAFDADHVAAIDNTTRTLLAEKRPAGTAGLWFALGHSTIVVGAVTVLVVGVGLLAPQLQSDFSPLAMFAGIWGPLVSSAFLIAVAGLNIRSLVRSRSQPEGEQSAGGPVSRALIRRGIRLDRPWKMYVVGLLFGLGFDTASTIALIVLAGGAVVALPWYAALVFPLLFTAGMALCDGLNGIGMSRIYAWGIEDRSRRRFDTALLSMSVLSALLVAAVGLASVAVEQVPGIEPVLAPLASLDLGVFGFVIAGSAAAIYLAGLLSRRSRRIGSRTETAR